MSTQEEAQALLDEIWPYLGSKTNKPKIKFRRQRRTGLYWSETHEITLREDSWNHMPLAAKRLLVVHEANHAAGMKHQVGYGTSFDVVSILGYKRIWGEDEPWNEMIATFEKLLDKFWRP